MTQPQRPLLASEPAETDLATDGEFPFDPPRYGHAAAIYALYQQGPKPRRKPPRPRRPGGGKLVRALTGLAALLRGPVLAEA